jgi:hypothetical protein
VIDGVLAETEPTELLARNHAMLPPRDRPHRIAGSRRSVLLFPGHHRAKRSAKPDSPLAMADPAGQG